MRMDVYSCSSRANKSSMWVDSNVCQSAGPSVRPKQRDYSTGEYSLAALRLQIIKAYYEATERFMAK